MVFEGQLKDSDPGAQSTTKVSSVVIVDLSLDGAECGPQTHEASVHAAMLFRASSCEQWDYQEVYRK